MSNTQGLYNAMILLQHDSEVASTAYHTAHRATQYTGDSARAEAFACAVAYEKAHVATIAFNESAATYARENKRLFTPGAL